MVFQFDIYREDDRWYFDDRPRGIIKEEFVEGVPEMILAIAKNSAARRVVLEVSTLPTEAADGILDYVPSPGTKDVYYRLGSIRGWFCPVFWKYFQDAPPTLWVRVLKVQ